MNLFDRVRVLGLWEPELQVCEQHPSGLEIRRLRTLLRLTRTRWPALRRGALSKMLGGLSFLQYGLVAAWYALSLRPSHISCHNLLLLPIAWMAAKISGSKLVYVPHELEVERTGLSVSMKRLALPVERTFIRGCSAVVTVCEPIAEWYRDRYNLPRVFVVRAIPEIQQAAKQRTHRADIRRKHKVPDQALLFIYQGVLASERGVDELLHTFRHLDDRFHLMLMGYGEAVERIRTASTECARIHFQEAVPVEQIIQYSGAADVGVFVIKDPISLSYQLSLPNKFFEYLSAGLPIVVSPNLRLLTQITSENRIGWVSECSNLHALIQTLQRADIDLLRPNVLSYVSCNTWEEERTRYVDIYSQ